MGGCGVSVTDGTVDNNANETTERRLGGSRHTIHAPPPHPYYMLQRYPFYLQGLPGVANQQEQ